MPTTLAACVPLNPDSSTAQHLSNGDSGVVTPM
jgi:hypothetical protein